MDRALACAKIYFLGSDRVVSIFTSDPVRYGLAANASKYSRHKCNNDLKRQHTVPMKIRVSIQGSSALLKREIMFR